MKPALFHPKARAVLRSFPDDVRREVGKAIFDLQKGAKLSMPLSRQMLSVAAGVEELRMKDRSGAYRVFYYIKTGDGGRDLTRISEEDCEDASARNRVSEGATQGDAMKKVKPVVARNAKELAKALGLTPADAVEFEIRSALNDKIIEVVNERGLTHAQVATLSHTSRTRVTAILNRNTHDISTDLMLRVLGSLGVQAKLQFTKAA